MTGRDEEKTPVNQALPISNFGPPILVPQSWYVPTRYRIGTIELIVSMEKHPHRLVRGPEDWRRAMGVIKAGRGKSGARAIIPLSIPVASYV